MKGNQSGLYLGNLWSSMYSPTFSVIKGSQILFKDQVPEVKILDKEDSSWCLIKKLKTHLAT